MEDVIKRPVGSSNILLVILIQFTNNESVFVFIRVEKALFEALWGNISITAYTRWMCRLDSLLFLRKVTLWTVRECMLIYLAVTPSGKEARLPFYD